MEDRTRAVGFLAGVAAIVLSGAAFAEPPGRTTAPAPRTAASFEVPVVAHVAAGIGATGMVMALVSFPLGETGVSPGPVFTGVTLGIGAAGMATAGVIIWSAHFQRGAADLRAAVGPGHVTLGGRF